MTGDVALRQNALALRDAQAVGVIRALLHTP